MAGDEVSGSGEQDRRNCVNSVNRVSGRPVALVPFWRSTPRVKGWHAWRSRSAEKQVDGLMPATSSEVEGGHAEGKASLLEIVIHRGQAHLLPLRQIQ